MKKIIAFVLIFIATNVLAAPYHYKVGEISEVWYANYSTYVCIKIDSDWYFLNISEGQQSFLKSMVLSAYAAKSRVHAGSSEGEQVSRCDGRQAYPLKVFRLM